MKLNLTDEETNMLVKGLAHLKSITTSDNAKSLIESVYRKLTEQTIDISYLHGLSQEAIKLYQKYMDEYNVDLYHSIASIYGIRKLKNENITVDELYTEYFFRYKSKRPLILEDTNSLYEFVEHVYNKING